jgi:hypothetical protein
LGIVASLLMTASVADSGSGGCNTGIKPIPVSIAVNR